MTTDLRSRFCSKVGSAASGPGNSLSVEMAPLKSRASNAVHLTRRSLAFLAKAAISVALLYFCLRTVDFAVLAQRLTRLDFRWVAFILATLALQIVAATIRWQQIVLQCGAPL